MILFLPPFFNHCIFFKTVFTADLHFNHRFILCWPLATFLAKMDQFMTTIMAIILENGHYGHHGTTHFGHKCGQGHTFNESMVKMQISSENGFEIYAMVKK